MARKNERRRENRDVQLPTAEMNQPSNTPRRFKHWRILVIILLLIFVAVTAGLLRNYKSSVPRECYYCVWIASADATAATTLSDHPCGRDQRNASSTIKKCNSDQQFCGTLHVSLSSTNQGLTKKVDFAFIRDCFTEYPLKYLMNFDNTNRTYYGTREGNLYPNIGGRQLNMTVIGKQCSDWNLCNSNHPKVNLAASFFDSITIIQEAKETVTNVWSALIEFINEAKINFDGSQAAI